MKAIPLNAYTLLVYTCTCFTRQTDKKRRSIKKAKEEKKQRERVRGRECESKREQNVLNQLSLAAFYIIPSTAHDL